MDALQFDYPDSRQCLSTAHLQDHLKKVTQLLVGVSADSVEMPGVLLDDKYPLNL